MFPCIIHDSVFPTVLGLAGCLCSNLLLKVLLSNLGIDEKKSVWFCPCSLSFSGNLGVVRGNYRLMILVSHLPA